MGGMAAQLQKETEERAGQPGGLAVVELVGAGVGA